MEKIKILQVVPFAEKGGVEDIATSLLYKIDNSKYTVRYVYFNKEKETFDNKTYISGFRDLLSYTKKNKIDIIHSHTPSLKWMIYLKFVSLIQRCKIVTTIHSDFGLCENKTPLYKKGKRFFILKMINKLGSRLITDEWIVVSAHIKSFLISRVGIKKEAITIIKNTVKSTTIDINNEKNRKSILFIGRNSPEKNINDLYNLWDKLKKESNYIYLKIIGIEQQDVINDDRVKALGWLPEKEVDEESKDALLQIIPSLYEGAPLVCFKALEKNIPVISYNIPALINIKENYGGIYTAPINDIFQLQKITEEVISKIRNGFKLETKEIIQKNHSIHLFIKNHQELYVRLINYRKNKS
ncbi:glycosyltransferase family 4 protein [Morganella morganii subsp. morganii]|uniref:glycosyltransferase family 4 protein n=1 Tax=Morganella morganii TaxID=582 RepID=UPI001BD99ABE|nr:glycosyltransferase family 4 protein [Morganella morganii]MBT0395906.1 glycosyltransferase family 4 protein [Morganella morganii subsp. morganii]